MTYAVHRRGFRISRQILSGLGCFTDGTANQLTGDMYVSTAGLLVTRPAYIDEITAQLPQPRGNTLMNAYNALNPFTGTAMPNPTDAIWYFWDFPPFSPGSFAGTPIVTMPHTDLCVLQFRPWGNGVSGGGVGSDPASARTSTTGSYTLPINRRFSDGLLAFFQNPDKTAVLTLQNRVGNFLVGDVLTGSGGGSGTGGVVRVVTGGGDTLILNNNSITPPAAAVTHYTVGRHITGTSGAVADVLTYESELIQQLNCQVNMIWTPTQTR